MKNKELRNTIRQILKQQAQKLQHYKDKLKHGLFKKIDDHRTVDFFKQIIEKTNLKIIRYSPHIVSNVSFNNRRDTVKADGGY